jgi:hypothetical protein
MPDTIEGLRIAKMVEAIEGFLDKSNIADTN